MYANSHGQAGSPTGLSNNPFVDDPTTAHARFPDLTASSPYPQQYPQQYHPSYVPGGLYQAQSQQMAAQNQFTPTPYAPQYSAQPHMGPQPTGIGAFHPAGGFSQTQTHQQYPIQQLGYPAQTNATPNYLSEFDPYAQQQTTPQIQSPMDQTYSATTSGGGAPLGISHPRDLIRIHKAGLEAWDVYSWKQLLGACDALKEAWSVRKQQAESIVRQYGGHSDPGLFGPDPAFGYNSQVEGWKQVFKDASDNFDTVAASTFQLHEVFNSYRHSGDQASKRRVRESCNAAVKGLPDWPSN